MSRSEQPPVPDPTEAADDDATTGWAVDRDRHLDEWAALLGGSAE